MVGHVHRGRETGDGGRRGVGDRGPPAAVGSGADLVLEGRGGGGHLEGGGGRGWVHGRRAEGLHPDGGVQETDSETGDPWMTKVTLALMGPGVR